MRFMQSVVSFVFTIKCGIDKIHVYLYFTNLIFVMWMLVFNTHFYCIFMKVFYETNICTSEFKKLHNFTIYFCNNK